MTEAEKHQEDQLQKMVEELNVMQTKYDTRLLSAVLAGRAAMLHVALVNGNIISQEDATNIWNVAGKVIEDGSDSQPKIMYKDGDDVFDAPTPEELN